jgi:hypothetical protein
MIEVIKPGKRKGKWVCYHCAATVARLGMA